MISCIIHRELWSEDTRTTNRLRCISSLQDSGRKKSYPIFSVVNSTFKLFWRSAFSFVVTSTFKLFWTSAFSSRLFWRSTFSFAVNSTFQIVWRSAFSFAVNPTFQLFWRTAFSFVVNSTFQQFWRSAFSSCRLVLWIVTGYTWVSHKYIF